MLTTRRMEHGSPLLVDFDLGVLMGAQKKIQEKDESAVADFIKMMAIAGKARAVRKISALVHATDDQLRQAESDPKVMAALEEEAALRPFADSFLDAIGFFGEWNASFGFVRASSAPEKDEKNPSETQGDSRSAASSPLSPAAGKPRRTSRPTKP